MTFRRGARIDTGQVRDVRGMSRGTAIGGGGGLIGIVALLVIVFLNGGSGGDLSGLSELLGGPVGGSGGPTSTALADCKTGADANASDDCRIVGYVNSIQAYWNDWFTRNGNRYAPSTTTFFDGQLNTGCGVASSETGPFYCPTDKNVYIDLGFFVVLRDRFGGSAAPFAQAYVMAHEYGHHVQDLLGDLGQQGAGADGGSVRTELQADCYAGVWGSNAVSTGYLEPITDIQINDALEAAQAVGDDRIQRATTGRVDPETFSHGTAAQRQQWFKAGYNSGDPGTCDTFRVDI
ncbi:MAG: neutral zinc metallopeptidase [Candidatus Limnocylindria bacterium]